MRIKGGHYKEWAVDRTIQEGPRADYAAKKTTSNYYNQSPLQCDLRGCF